MTKFPDISVIILTFNSSKTIMQCLEHMQRIRYPKEKLKIIVLDHGSTDDTCDIACKFDVDLHQFPDATTISELRNLGASLADTEVIAFLDSDCLASEDWLLNAVETMRNEQVDVTGGDYLIRKDSTWVERSWYEHRKIDSTRDVNVIYTGNFIITRKAFDDVDGFDAEFVAGEDYDICLRLREKGYRLISSDRIKVVHLGEARGLKSFFLKEIWRGGGMLRMLARHPARESRQVPLISLLYLSGYIAAAILSMTGAFRLAGILLFTMLLFIPAVCSIRSAIKSNKQNIPGILLLFILYFTARAVSILKYNQLFKMVKMFSRKRAELENTP